MSRTIMNLEESRELEARCAVRMGLDTFKYSYRISYIHYTSSLYRIKFILYYKITKFSILPLKFNKNSYIIFLERERYGS